MKRLTVQMTTAEVITCLLALDRLIHERGDQSHIVASAARTLLEQALVGEGWPESVDPALTLGDFA